MLIRYWFIMLNDLSHKYIIYIVAISGRSSNSYYIMAEGIIKHFHKHATLDFLKIVLL